MIYITLFFEFFKIGLFSIGGGLATLPFLYQLAGKFFWLSAEDIPNMLAVVQLLPGGVGINLTAYTGYHISVLGSYIAVLGIITPQIFCISFIARVFNQFSKNGIVQRCFAGLLPAAAGLLSAASFQVIKLSLYNSNAEIGYQMINLAETGIFAVIFVLVCMLKRLHPAVFIAAAGVLGAILKL
ncbi:MAG: chromate transporter [Spirochaetaceae bacterium]|jgi:chromate transporter|nr:chromate transporter [Spirochaetaceae bacterium]